MTTFQDCIGDDALKFIGQFLASAINANLITTWQSLSKSSSEVIPYVYYNDPRTLLDESKLPALYLWRSKAFGQGDRITDTIYVSEGQIEIRWIMESAQDETAKLREAFFSDLAAEIQVAIRSERDPAWVLTGDTSAYSLANGSSIWTACNWLQQPVIGLFTPERLEVPIIDGDGKTVPLLCVSGSLRVFEQVDLTQRSHGNASVHASVMTGPNLDLDISSITS